MHVGRDRPEGTRGQARLSGVRRFLPHITAASMHARQNQIGGAVAICKGFDVDQDLLAHLDSPFEGG